MRESSKCVGVVACMRIYECIQLAVRVRFYELLLTHLSMSVKCLIGRCVKKSSFACLSVKFLSECFAFFLYIFQFKLKPWPYVVSFLDMPEMKLTCGYCGHKIPSSSLVSVSVSSYLFNSIGF